MEYMLRTDPFFLNETYHLPQTIFSAKAFADYYFMMNCYGSRFFVMVLWIVNCMLCNFYVEDDRKDYYLFRYSLMYALCSLLTHALLFLHKAVDDIVGRAEANSFVTPFFIISLLTSYSLRVVLLLYIYSRMEFALARYRYPLCKMKYLYWCLSCCVFFATSIFIIKHATKSNFQVVIGLDHLNLIVITMLVLLCTRLLFNEITCFVGLKGRVVHFRLIFIYKFIFCSPCITFLACMLTFPSYNIYANYSALVADVIFNFQPLFILILMVTAKFKFGTIDAEFDYRDEPGVSSAVIWYKPLVTLWNNFSCPINSPAGSWRQNTPLNTSQSVFSTSQSSSRSGSLARSRSSEPLQYPSPSWLSTHHRLPTVVVMPSQDSRSTDSGGTFETPSYGTGSSAGTFVTARSTTETEEDARRARPFAQPVTLRIVEESGSDTQSFHSTSTLGTQSYGGESLSSTSYYTARSHDPARPPSMLSTSTIVEIEEPSGLEESSGLRRRHHTETSTSNVTPISSPPPPPLSMRHHPPMERRHTHDVIDPSAPQQASPQVPHLGRSRSQDNVDLANIP